MTILGDNQFGNVRITFIDFMVKEMAKTDYGRNNISHRGEIDQKLKTDDVRCRNDGGLTCGLNRPEYKTFKAPASNKCNTYTCPFWLPTFMNLDEIDFKIQDRRIFRIDFISREMVNARYDIIQVGIWSNKGDDLYRHKQILLRDTVVGILRSDINTGLSKRIKILDWDNPIEPIGDTFVPTTPPALGGSPQSDIYITIHLKDNMKRPVKDDGEFGEVLTVWLVSSITPRLAGEAPGD